MHRITNVVFAGGWRSWRFAHWMQEQLTESFPTVYFYTKQGTHVAFGEDGSGAVEVNGIVSYGFEKELDFWSEYKYTSTYYIFRNNGPTITEINDKYVELWRSEEGQRLVEIDDYAGIPIWGSRENVTLLEEWLETCKGRAVGDIDAAYSEAMMQDEMKYDHRLRYIDFMWLQVES